MSCPCRLAESEGDSDSPGTWIRLAELESRSISLQREVQESRGEAMDAEAALKLATREVEAMRKVRRSLALMSTEPRIQHKPATFFRIQLQVSTRFSGCRSPTAINTNTQYSTITHPNQRPRPSRADHLKP